MRFVDQKFIKHLETFNFSKIVAQWQQQHTYSYILVLIQANCQEKIWLDCLQQDKTPVLLFDSPCCLNKLAKARKMRKPPGTLGLKKFGPGKIWVKNVWTQNTCILAFLHTFILISENPTRTQNFFFDQKTFLKIIQFIEKIYNHILGQVFWVQTFSIQILPGPNFFKPSVPGGLRIFRAFASLFLCTLPLHSFIHRGATCSWWPLVLATFSSCSSSSPATSSSITSFTRGPFDDDWLCPLDASFLYQSNSWFQPYKLQSVEHNQRIPLLPALVHISR